jgi:hypothetical protein
VVLGGVLTGGVALAVVVGAEVAGGVPLASFPAVVPAAGLVPAGGFFLACVGLGLGLGLGFVAPALALVWFEGGMITTGGVAVAGSAAGEVAGGAVETVGAVALGGTVVAFFSWHPVISTRAKESQIPSWDEWRFITTITPLYRALSGFACSGGS